MSGPPEGSASLAFEQLVGHESIDPLTLEEVPAFLQALRQVAPDFMQVSWHHADEPASWPLSSTE
jgi:hypothetical protein